MQMCDLGSMIHGVLYNEQRKAGILIGLEELLIKV